jgi:catechol 2,3-dioxygenase-like lactoylglutathione lyase family enzyme
MSISLNRTVPILRIFSVDKAKEFYVDYLGFALDWGHSYEANFPEYLQVSRDGVVLHLSEHHGDGTPGAALMIQMAGIDALHEELEATSWGARQVKITDPFGNRLMFTEFPPAEKP